MTKGEISAFIDTISPTGPGGVIKIKKVLRELLKQKKEGEVVTVEELEEALLEKQDTLVSGENVKTVGGQSIVGKGNIEVGDKDAIKFVLQQLTEAQKAQARANIDAYKKPSTGIPASDIANGVIPDISGKQDTITDLQEIRSGAAAGATAVQPSALNSKQDVISDLPTIRSGAALGSTSVQPAELNELKDEVDTIGNGAYEEAWDGDSIPVVADIPAGVVVTYSSASYTGTLAASASTVDKIYLVSDGNGNYDRYTTIEVNGAYSWKKVGSTAIPLSNYAMRTQVSQLQQEVGHFDTPIDLHYASPTSGKYVNYRNGALYDSGVCSVVICDVSKYVGRALHFSRARIPATEGLQGMAFFDAGGNYISGQQGVLNASAWGIELSSLEIPNGAALAKLSCPASELENFQAYVHQNAKEATDLLEAKVGDFVKETIQYGSPTSGKYVKFDTGQLLDSSANSAITGVDVSGIVGKTLYYSRVLVPSANGVQGIAFYGQSGYISGVQGKLNAESWGIELASVVVPEGALTASFTCPASLLSEFQLYYEQAISDGINELKTRTTDNEGDIATLTSALGLIEETTTPLASKRILTTSDEWQNGMISSGGETASSNNTIITKKKISLASNAYVRIGVNAGYKYRVIFFSAYGNDTIAVPANYGVEEGEYDDLKVWHQDERILAIPAGSPCYTVTVRKIDESSIAPGDCTNVFCHNSYGVELVKEIPILKENGEYGAQSLLDGINRKTLVSNGVTFEYKGGGIFNVYGTATDSVLKTLLGGVNTIPNGCEPGKTIFLSGMTNDVPFQVQEYENGSIAKGTSIPRPATYKIGANTTGVIILMVVRNGITLNEQVRPVVLNAYPNDVLSMSLEDYIQNNRNILDRDTVSRTITHNGITYTFDGDKWNVAGTSSSTSWAEILGTSRMIPDGLEAGKLVKVKYSGENVALHIVQYDSTPAVIQSTMFYSDGIVAIDANAKGIVVRLRVAAGVTLDEDVTPVIINHLDEGDISKELYTLQQSSDGSTREEKIVQCAKSYYVMTRANKYTYGERSALYYGDGGELNQVHCGGLTALLASGCPFYSSRYVHPESVNESFAAGYGFDFEAYSLRLAQAGVQSEIDYIGEENVNKSVQELKELMLFKTSYKLSTSCLRWGMIEYIQSGSTIDTSKMRVGDILFYGHPDDGSPKVIDGQLITPVLIEGNLIGHCDTVIEIRDGTPYVIDAGAAPISIHPFNPSSYYTYVCIGRVPLFDIIM